MLQALWRPVLKGGGALSLVAAITFVYARIAPANPTTVALTYLTAVVILAAWLRLPFALLTAISSALAFTYFFLPPYASFVVAERHNIVALLAFLLSAVVASQVSERAIRRTQEANRHRHQLERLYSLSERLLMAHGTDTVARAVPEYLVELFGFDGAALFLTGHNEYHASGNEHASTSPLRLRDAAVTGEVLHNSNTVVLPLRIGNENLGSLGITGRDLSRETLDAIAGLLAIAIQRADAVEQLAKTNAIRESERLRTALVDSVAHAFRTPLTSIKAAVTALLPNTRPEDTQGRELLTVVNEETDRLNCLVGEAAQMAQLAAHQVQLQLECQQIRDVVEASLAECKDVIQSNPVEVDIPERVPGVIADRARMVQVITHLLENAAKYSLPGSPIRIACEAAGSEVRTCISDAGPGIPEDDRPHIFDVFYRGRHQRHSVHGTGMGLAIAKAIVDAHGGKIGITNRTDAGCDFWFTLPLAQ